MADFIDGIHKILDNLGVPKTDEDGKPSVLATRIEKETSEWVEKRITELMKQVAMAYPEVSKNPMVKDLIKTQLTKFAEECYGKGAQTAHRLAMVDE
jgi:hypothetical protein